jgi:hypothetical protein
MFNVSAGGSLPLNYQWFFNGTNFIGINTNSFTLNNAQSTSAGNYWVVITNVSGSITSTMAVLTVNTGTTGTVTLLAGWDMSSLSNYGPSPLPATTSDPNLTVGGLARGNGVTTLNTATARAWGGNSFDSTSSNAAVSAGDFATFSVSANAGRIVSFTAISRYDYRRSNAGPPNGVFQYQVGSGGFMDITNVAYTSTSGASLGPIDLSGIAALQNLAASNVVTFRIVNYGASSSGGNWYIYDLANSTAADLAIQGIINSTSNPTNPPASPAILGAPGFNAGQFQMLVTGSAGSNYVMQASTNLATANWMSLLTNASPFVFTDMNLVVPQKFYRAIVQP